MNLSRVDLPNRLRLANETRNEYVQFLRSDTRRVEIVVPPRLTCTETRPLQPSALERPLGRVRRPEIVKVNAGRRSLYGVTRALSLPLPLRRESVAVAGGGVCAAGGGGGGGAGAGAGGGGGPSGSGAPRSLRT